MLTEIARYTKKMMLKILQGEKFESDPVIHLPYRPDAQEEGAPDEFDAHCRWR